MRELKSDVIIVGCGVAGLYCALNLPSNRNITIITKAKAEECDSYLAQGGICVLRDDDDYDSYFEDTMRAGHYENNKESVDIMIRSSQSVIKDLIKFGTRFERNKDGSLNYTREGAHSAKRILFHEDITGEEITSHLLQEVRKLKNVTFYEDVTMVDIITARNSDNEDSARGLVTICDQSNEIASYKVGDTLDGKAIVPLYAPEIVWACGGIGGLFEHSTNFPHLTGDALGIALKHNIPLQNPDYIQIHPTTLYNTKKGRSFLISESVRGEGGILLDKNGNRFVNELLPRDVVANAIFQQMKKDDTKFVYLSMENISEEEIKTHFCHIYEKCLEEGFDCTKEPIPVVPAQHYFMGGIDVDRYSKTSMQGLYAVGETSCNGVHGKNRLASNSLLEALVFAKRAANHIVQEFNYVESDVMYIPKVDFDTYKDTVALMDNYKQIIMNEIERSKKIHELNKFEVERR